MELTGSQIVMECLLEQGVDTVFGYPGGTILNIYDELYKYSDKIKHILTGCCTCGGRICKGNGQGRRMYGDQRPRGYKPSYGNCNRIYGFRAACCDYGKC